jgi:ankyrin repeat protein
LKTSLIVLIHSFVISQSTPLHSAAMNGRLEICQCLVESKADVSLKNKSTSPLRLLHTVSLTFSIAEAVKLHSTWPTTAARLMSSNICRGCKSDLGAFAITNKRVYAQYHHHHTSQHRHHSQQ